MPYITEAQRSENRKKILRCTYHLFIREGEKMTTQMVCAEAKVGKGTLFTYFPTKETLLHEAYVEADRNACRLTWRDLSVTDDKRAIIRQLIENAKEWPLQFPEEVIFSERYNDMAHHDLYSGEFSGEVESALDAPGVSECLLKGIASETIRNYAKSAASAQIFSFMIYLVNHPEEVGNQALIDYVVDRVTGFFTV